MAANLENKKMPSLKKISVFTGATLISIVIASVAIARQTDEDHDFGKNCTIRCIQGSWSQSSSGGWSCSSGEVKKSKGCPGGKNSEE
jgi:hypothetical protein